VDEFGSELTPPRIVAATDLSATDLGATPAPTLTEVGSVKSGEIKKEVTTKMASGDRTNQAERLAHTTSESYKAFADSTVTLQERNVRFALDMLGDSIQELHRQAESNRILSRELAEQSASRRLAENPADTYAGFLFTPFSYYRQVLRSLG